jgi:type III restriction enzyme
LNASDTRTLAEMAPTVDGKPDVTKIEEIDLEDLGRKFRLQRITFEAARDIFDQMRPAWRGDKDDLLIQLIRLVEEFLRADRIRIDPPLFNQGELRRRIIYTLNMNRIVQHLWGAIKPENTTDLKPVFDEERPIRETGDMRPWWTGRPCGPAERSHVNVCVYDGTWEATEAFVLDRSGRVDAWVKNDHLGFEVLYVHRGVTRKYRPDFLIRLKNGRMLVLEVKGVDSEESRTKRQALAEWVAAVNRHGGFGEWASDISFSVNDIHEILDRHGGTLVVTAAR